MICAAASVAALLLCLSSSAITQVSAGLYGPDDKVVQLEPDSFEKLVSRSNGVAVVEFFAPWCGHCQKLAPHYKSVAKKLSGIALVGSVDCDQAANKVLCTRYQIKGFPTLKLFGPERQKNPYTGEYSKEAQDYTGSLTAKPITDAVTALLTDVHITRVKSSKDLAALLASAPTLAKVLLFSSKSESSTLYKALSSQLQPGLAFAEVHESVGEVVAKYDVTSFPTVIVVKADGVTHEAYDGELKSAPLTAFLAQFSSAPAGAGDASSGGGAKAGGGGKGGGGSTEPKKSSVQDVAFGDLEGLDAKEAMWLLAFHGAAERGESGDAGGEGEEAGAAAAGACAAAVREFRDAVAVMQDVVRSGVVALEEAQYEEVVRYGVSSRQLASSPCQLQLVLLPFGEDKGDLDEYQRYEGPMEGKALQAFVTDAMPSFVERVTGPTADRFIADLGAAADPGRASSVNGQLILSPKILLMTKQADAPGVFRALAANFRGRANMAFGWLKADDAENAEFVAKMRPPKIPHVVMLFVAPEVNANVKKTGEVGVSMQPYTGPLKYNSLAAWLNKIAGLIERDSGAGDERDLEKIHEVTDEASFKRLCTETDLGLCVLGLLDSDARSMDFPAQKRAYASLAAMRDGQPFSFAWLDAAKHRVGGRQHGDVPLLNALGVMQSDLPTMAVLSTKRRLQKWTDAMRVGVLANQKETATEFNAVRMTNFIDVVVKGAAKMNILHTFPTLSGHGGVATEDGAPPPNDEPVLQDEFDLGDIMGGLPIDGMTSRIEILEREDARAAREEAELAAAEAEVLKNKAAKKKKKKSKKGKKAKEEL